MCHVTVPPPWGDTLPKSAESRTTDVIKGQSLCQGPSVMPKSPLFIARKSANIGTLSVFLGICVWEFALRACAENFLAMRPGEPLSTSVNASLEPSKIIQGYYRFPTLHGNTVVFASEDDLWTVPADGGVARRLTANLSAISHPYFSPKGDLLAFTAKEEGHSEVYTMPSGGGGKGQGI